MDAPHSPQALPMAAPTPPRARGSGNRDAVTSRLFSTQAAVIGTGLALGLLVSLGGAGIGAGAMGALVFLALSMRTIRPAILAAVGIMMLFGRDELYHYDISFGGGGLKPSDLLLLVVMGSWLARVVVLNRPVLRLPRLFSALVLVFLVVATVNSIGAIIGGYYFKDTLLELRPLLQYLLVFPLMAEFDTDMLRKSIWFLLMLSVVSSIRILVNYWMGVGQVLLYGEGIRVVLLELGAYLPPVILGFTYYLFSIRPAFSLFVGLFNLTALAVTFFRSAYLGLSTGMLFIFLSSDNRVRRAMIRMTITLVLLGVAAGVGYTVVRPGGNNPFESIVTRLLSLREFKEDISALHRLREWEAASHLIEKNPIWGNGLGTRIIFESPMYNAEERRLGYLSDDVYMHNSYMWLLVKMGAVGFVSFLLIPLCAIFTVRKSLRYIADPTTRAMQLAMGGILAGNMVISVFGPMFNIDNMTPINAFILGSVFILAREGANPWESEI